MNWLNIVIGLFLLFTGRGLFWLFVACVGFASGYHYAQQVWAIHSPLTILIISLAAGGVGAIIAIFFQKAAIVIAGFAAGGYVVLSLLGQFNGLAAQMIWLPYIIGGIIGAVILYFTFDWALIVLSTLTGASLIVQMVTFSPLAEIALFLVLVIVGMAFQAKIMTGERPAK
jgi:hypothetical protein